MKWTLKGKNKVPPTKTITYNSVTKKIRPKDDSSNIKMVQDKICYATIIIVLGIFECSKNFLIMIPIVFQFT